MARRRTPSGERWIEHAVTATEAGTTVRDVLRGALGVSGRMIQRLTRTRGIRLGGRPTHLTRVVREGEIVSARVAAEEPGELPPVEMPLDVVYEDDDVLVVNKPAFLLVHPVAPHHTRTLAHGIAHHFRARGLRARVRPVHRLDRNTSGLLLVARTAFAHQRLDRQIREGGMRRAYLALVHGAVQPEVGRMEEPIARDPERAGLRMVHASGDPAATRYRVVERLAGATLLELELETGRTHQIRVHLAHRGHPIVGDGQYGGSPAAGLERQALHAWALVFHHPVTGREIRLEAPPPDDFAEALRRLRETAPG